MPTREIPWQCWDIPGFKACHTEAGAQAHRDMSQIGAEPGTDIWNKFYPEFLRTNVYKCQILHKCTKEDVEDILARLKNTEVQQTTQVWPFALAAAGVLGVALFFRYKRAL